jgi:hypothetical protein
VVDNRAEETVAIAESCGCLTAAIGLSALSAILSLLRLVPFWLLSYQHESCCWLGLPTWVWAVGIVVQVLTLAALLGVWRRRRRSLVTLPLLYPI